MEEKKKKNNNNNNNNNDEIIKMEDTTTSGGDGGGGCFPFSDQNTMISKSLLLDDFSDANKCSVVGFMELLGVDEFSSEVLNNNPPAPAPAPATPNSSSVSSASSDAPNDELNPHEHHKPTKRLKGKKRKEKREKEARFAFMTKSEVDNLEDGYRWRKYGQKAVKNSPFPRSYYRCTSSACNVKKRVERSFADPAIVVTTYEGQHTHPSPVLARSALAATAASPLLPLPSDIVSGGGCGSIAAMPWLKATNHAHEGNIPGMTHQYFQNPTFFIAQDSDVNYNRNLIGAANAAGILQERRFCNPNTAFLADHGLLQDVVPPHMLKQE